jgi:hypothetical protein
LANTECEQGGERHDVDVFGRRSPSPEQTRVGGGDTAVGVGINPDGQGSQRRSERLDGSGEGLAWALGTKPFGDAGEIESRLGEPNDGLSRWVDGRLARPWDGGWEDGIPRVTSVGVDRVNKLKALGNAIVPQIAYTIMGAMLYAELDDANA